MKSSIRENIVVALTTFYPFISKSDIYRSRLAEKTIKLLIKKGYKVIIIDGGSNDLFLQKIQKYEVILYKQKVVGFGIGKREVIKKAYKDGRDIIVLMEPEKVDFVKEIKQLARTLFENKKDMIIPKRSSLESYPIIQNYTENICNKLLKEISQFQQEFDICFGPVLFKRNLAKYYLEYRGEYGDTWDAIHIPILKACTAGKKILSVEIEYTHPKEQKSFEEHDLNFYDKRIYLQLLPLLAAYKSYFAKKIRS